MTLQRRLSIARTLTIIQLVLSSVVFAIVLAFGAFAVGSFLAGQLNGMAGEAPLPMLFMGLMLLLVLLFALAVVALPWIVLMALKKRNEKWATAAFVSLIIQIVLAGGVFAIFPIVTLILLLDKEASAYIGMK
jgi:hypothetical protein